MKDGVVALIRALLGGEIDDRDAVRVVRALRAEVSASAAADALVTALERAHLQASRRHGRRLGLHTAAGAVFGGLGGASGLWALGAALPQYTRWAALLPLLGVAVVVASLVRVRRATADAVALPMAVAHELMRAGVSDAAAVAAAAHVAGKLAEPLRAELASVITPEGVRHDRGAAAILSSRLDDAGAMDRARRRAGRGVLAGALWVVVSFWVAWIAGVARGYAGAP